MIEWLRRHFPQDDFAGDWYGWLTNQLGHIALGLAAVLFLSIVWFVFFGEMPVKWILWLACLGAYLAIEYVRGWNGWDSVEDTVFTVFYGAGGVLVVFSEVTPGEPLLEFSILQAGGIAAIAALHLVYGVLRRW